MRRWLPAVAPLLLTVAGIIVFLAVNPTTGLLIVTVSIATQWIPFGTRVVGRTPEKISGPVDPQELRAYRVSHPGATIGDALTSVERDGDAGAP